ncbi:MAG: ribonuclease Z, partial [Methanobacteriaceae archaeon]|nr:ribonuclease Z [Methanobacteriaceae archaeon]
MEIIFLGTSSAIPTKHRNHASIALKAFGEILLFDCGEGTQRQMAHLKLSPMKIKKIFISHLHGDHILGLPGIIQSMGFRGRTEPLDIYGPPGIQNIKEAIMNFGYFSLNFEITFNELEDGIVIDHTEYNIECIQTQHNVPNFSYSIIEKKKPKFLKDKAIELGIEPGPDFSKLHDGIPVKIGNKTINPEQVLGKSRNGIKIVYSGDTMPCDALVELAKGADILIHESTFGDEDQNKAIENWHSTAKEAAEVAKKA